MGARGSQVVEALCYKSESHGFISWWYLWNFLLIWSSRPHYKAGVDSVSNRNEDQEYFLGVKAAGAQGWQRYHFHVPIVLKSENLNLLEHPGRVQASNGIALPLTFTERDGLWAPERAKTIWRRTKYYAPTGIRIVFRPALSSSP